MVYQVTRHMHPRPARLCTRKFQKLRTLKRCGKLKGLVPKFPYLIMCGGANGGTYISDET